MQYLKSSLSGEPAHLLRKIPKNAENIIRVWDLLKGTYQNTRLLVSSQIVGLCSLQPVYTESTFELKKLLYGTTRAIGALTALNVSSKHELIV